MRFQPEKCLYRFENGFKCCYRPYSLWIHLLGWSVLFRKFKNQESFGYLLNFPLKNGPPLKNEILQYLDLGLLLKVEILLKCVLLTPQYFYMNFSIFYILQTRRDILQTGIKEFRLLNNLFNEVSTIYIPIEILKWTWLKQLLHLFWIQKPFCWDEQV